MRARTCCLTLVSGALLALTAATADPVAAPAVPAAPPSPAAPGAPSAPAVAARRIQGTVTAFDGTFLTLKAGKQVPVIGLTGSTRFVHSSRLMLNGLAPGTYVLVAALKSTDGKLRATGIRVLPQGARGQGEGLYSTESAPPPIPNAPTRMLVGGTITTVAPGGIGGVITLTYRGQAASAATAGVCEGRAAQDGCTGSAAVAFARGVPINSMETGDVSQLLPGALVTVSAMPDANGTLVATAITIERDAPVPKTPPATPAVAN
jgi:hypothetical protein